LSLLAPHFPTTWRWSSADCLVLLAQTVDERERLNEAIKLVRRIGRRLKQRAMYFEVSDYDGVQFLRIE
jgi:hypothetical protein